VPDQHCGAIAFQVDVAHTASQIGVHNRFIDLQWFHATSVLTLG
jgi:hypothetical protein